MQTLLSVQYLRAIATIAVVLSHSWPAAFSAQSGVDVFFVISGFIIWSITARTSGTLAFWWHRLARVAPLYWIATIIMGIHQGAALMPMVKSMVFWPYFGEQGQIWPVMVPGWTINYEIIFYVAVGILLLLPSRGRLPAIATMIVSLSFLHAVVPTDNAVLLTYTNPIMLEFLGGIGLAELRRRGGLPNPRWALPLVGLALIDLALSTHTSVPDGWNRLLVWGLPGLSIVVGAVAWEAGGRTVRLPGLKLVGDASYSIYLAHSFVLKTMILAMQHYPLPVRIVVPVLLATCFGVGVHLLLERPLIRALRALGPTARRILVPLDMRTAVPSSPAAVRMNPIATLPKPAP